MYAKEPPDEAGRLHSRCREFAYSGSQLAFPGLPKQAIRTPRHAAHRGRARPGLVANFGSIFEGLTRPGAGEELAGPRRSVRGCLPLSVVWNMRRRVDETHAELGSAACRLRNPRRRRASCVLSIAMVTVLSSGCSGSAGHSRSLEAAVGPLLHRPESPARSKQSGGIAGWTGAHGGADPRPVIKPSAL